MKCGRLQSPAPELPSVRELIKQRSLSRSVSENPQEDIDNSGTHCESQKVITSMSTVQDEESTEPSQVGKESAESPKSCAKHVRRSPVECQNHKSEGEMSLIVGEVEPENDEVSKNIDASTSERVEKSGEKEKLPKSTNSWVTKLT